MLAIGGMTVAELESRMSHDELRRWILYVKQYGPLNACIRMEAAIGRAVLPFLKKGTKLKDLMPWPKEEMTEHAVANALMSAFKAGPGSGRKAKYRRSKR